MWRGRSRCHPEEGTDEGSRKVTMGVLFTGFFGAMRLRMTGGGGKSELVFVRHTMHGRVHLQFSIVKQTFSLLSVNEYR